MDEKFKFAESVEIEKRSREVQLLVNIVEPDPEYQPFFLSDDSNFYDVSGKDGSEIEADVRHYFKGDLPGKLGMPLWQFIDLVKQRYPGWPDDWPLEH